MEQVATQNALHLKRWICAIFEPTCQIHLRKNSFSHYVAFRYAVTLQRCLPTSLNFYTHLRTLIASIVTSSCTVLRLLWMSIAVHPSVVKNSTYPLMFSFIYLQHLNTIFHMLSSISCVWHKRIRFQLIFSENIFYSIYLLPLVDRRTYFLLISWRL